MGPENSKVVVGYDIGAANALATSADWIDCKNALKVYVWCKHSGTNDTDLTIELQEATDVAGTSAADITATMPIWADSDAGSSSDTLVRQTDAATYTIDPAAAGSSLVCFQFDPSKFSDGFDCLRIKGNGGDASNNVFAWYEIEPRYKPADDQTAIA